MKGIFPIWKRDTKELAQTFIDLRFEAIVICIDSEALERRFVGRTFDEKFLSDLPSRIDPCGENGEFHSFVHDGPIFRQKISHELGEVILRDNRFYLLPND